jgi:N,N-dimethylformamidase beta subunit-like, C-terminal/Concanavalin A-like lectin/glucanases superfamily
MSTAEIRRVVVSGLLLIIFAAGRAPSTIAGLAQNPTPTGRGSQAQGGRGASPGAQEALDRLGIIGYADHMTVQPGETIKFMVSSQSPRYRADIVRIIHGDANPKGPGMKETAVETSANREYAGQRQPLPLGSYATVADNAALRLAGSLSITAWIAPTRHDPLAPGGSAPNGDQGIVTKWSSPNQSGYGLFIEEDGRLALWLGEKGRVEKVRAQAPLRPWVPSIPGSGRGPRPHHVTTNWYFVAATYDATTGRVALYQRPLSEFTFDSTRTMTERTTAVKGVATNTAPLLIAAAYADGSPMKIGGHFNGKIDNPRIYSRSLSPQDVDALALGRGPSDAVASWDFSLDIQSDRIADTSTRKLNGVVVNLPTRAVTGHNWTGAEMDFKRAPQQYGAIYFHDDDLEDAKWDVGFEFKIPENLKSGVYAARLRTDSAEDYVPFFVRPKKGTATAKAAFLVPTFSYLAYGGTGGTGFNILSNYAHHTDGSGIGYSSRLRPITNMRPKISTRNPWQFMPDTHIVDWLEVKGFTVDVITDQDLHFEGAALLAPYKVVVTGTHPEYYSGAMLEGLHAYLEKGGRLMYMGGNGFYWVTPMDPTGRYIELRRRDGTEHWQGAPGESYHALTGEPGGLWRFRGLPPQRYFGVGFTAQGFDKNSPYKRMPDSFNPRAAFIFEGIGATEEIGNFPSLVLDEGAAGSELDRLDYVLGTPPHTLLLAQSYGHSDAYQQVVEEVNTSDSRQGGTVNPLVHADLAYLEYPNGGAVFSTGSIAWSGSLSYNNYTNNVSRLTENVLRRFSSDVPIPRPTLVPSGTSSQGRDRAKR